MVWWLLDVGSFSYVAHLFFLPALGVFMPLMPYAHHHQAVVKLCGKDSVNNLQVLGFVL